MLKFIGYIKSENLLWFMSHCQSAKNIHKNRKGNKIKSYEKKSKTKLNKVEQLVLQ